MIFLAMSSFQGRPQQDAFEALVRHASVGVQLTPGNLPSPGFEARVRRSGVPIRCHDGFDWSLYRRDVYDARCRPLAIDRDRSVHPPRDTAREFPRRSARGATLHTWAEFRDVALEHDLLVETMYPGYVLGRGVELEEAMDAGLRLAVDIAHLDIQRTEGAIAARTLRRLFDYDRVEEIHASTSERGRDLHRALRADSFGLAWARARGAEVPLVLESYWHRTDFDGQRRQLDLLRA